MKEKSALSVYFLSQAFLTSPPFLLSLKRRGGTLASSTFSFSQREGAVLYLFVKLIIFQINFISLFKVIQKLY